MFADEGLPLPIKRIMHPSRKNCWCVTAVYFELSLVADYHNTVPLLQYFGKHTFP